MKTITDEYVKELIKKIAEENRFAKFEKEYFANISDYLDDSDEWDEDESEEIEATGKIGATEETAEIGEIKEKQPSSKIVGYNKSPVRSPETIALGTPLCENGKENTRPLKIVPPNWRDDVPIPEGIAADLILFPDERKRARVKVRNLTGCYLLAQHVSKDHVIDEQSFENAKRATNLEIENTIQQEYPNNDAIIRLFVWDSNEEFLGTIDFRVD